MAAAAGEVVPMSSTLVQTVAINYEDFTESFLTCHTCLGLYDSQEHAPKLLPCSHTVCRSCLQHMHDLQGVDSTTLRCPICRETVAVPRGGVSLFPPSFLINQLLDLMHRQRRDVVPKCSVHPAQELMFCETCDTVFCVDCADGRHSDRGQTAHTVIPFSIAIKRMSEILLYKASQCMQNLNRAIDIVTEEMHKLEDSTEACMAAITRASRDIMHVLEGRQVELVDTVRAISASKSRVLLDQLASIQTERSRVEAQCQVNNTAPTDVRIVTKKIGDLNELLDTTGKLMEPHDNAFMRFDCSQGDVVRDIEAIMEHFGRICVSTTFPALCSVHLCKVVCHLSASVILTTVDYHGNPQTTGGDPVVVRLTSDRGDTVPTTLVDNNDGTYLIKFKATVPMRHLLYISILDRSLRESPFILDVSEHISPVLRFGNKGSGDSGLTQPVGLVCTDDSMLYILDTCNSRVKVIDSQGQYVRDLDNVGCEQRSATGIALSPSGTLLVVNWRSKCVTEFTVNGDIVRRVTSDRFSEPVSLAVCADGAIVVADNGTKQLLVLDSRGVYVSSIDMTAGQARAEFKLIQSIAIGPSDEILVVDGRMRAFSRAGQLLYEVKCSEGAAKGAYCSATYASGGVLLATWVEKGRGVIHVYDVASRRLLFPIDSADDRLSARPGGLAVLGSTHVAVTDMVANCVRVYQFV